MTTKIQDLLSREAVRQLTRKSDWRGAATILQTWALIALYFTLLTLFPHPLTFVLVVFLLGGQQLACAVLTHEAAHRTLFKTRRLNDGLTDWLCARPIWTDVTRYRQHHLKHHAHTGTDQDPDMSLVTAFPTSRRSLTKKLLRDITGLTGLRRIVGLIGMDIGMLEYTVAADVKRRPRNGRRWTDYATEGLRHMGPVLLSNLALFSILALCGVAWVYSAWIIAYLTSFSLFVRIRSIAEHACMPGGAYILSNTRTTRAGWLARLTVAPMQVNYHQEHHLMASVPCYRLPAMHRQLQARLPLVTPPDYRQVLRLASSRSH